MQKTLFKTTSIFLLALANGADVPNTKTCFLVILSKTLQYGFFVIIKIQGFFYVL